jgi:hypothetical protein
MFWIVQVVIVSFVIIFLLHHLYCFFKETLTVPKMKDMVKRPQQKYDTLFRELRMNNEESNGNAENDVAHANAAMKNELKRYLKEFNVPQPQSQPQSQHQPQQPEPEPHPQSNSNFIDIGSAYQ